MLRGLASVLALVPLVAHAGAKMSPTQKPARKLPASVAAHVDARHPAFLTSDWNPLFEELLADEHVKPTPLASVDHNAWDRPSQVSERGLLRLLELYRRISPKSTLITVGNNQYPAYLTLKTLFKDTPIGDRIVWVPSSRALAKSKDGARFTKVFDFWRLAERDGDLVVHDTITAGERPNEHELNVLGQALRGYLRSRGLPTRDILRRVVLYGTRETDRHLHSYAVHDLNTYRARMVDFAEWDVGDHTPSKVAPILLAVPTSLPYQNLHLGFFDYAGTYAWAGKYDRVGEDGFPTGKHALVMHGDASGFAAGDVPSGERTRQILARRLSLAGFYKDVIARTAGVAAGSPAIAARLLEIVRGLD